MERGDKSPVPVAWFGGKSRAASLIWARLGDVPNYVEPFFGSGAVMLGRPHEPGIETVNDKDGFVSNAWRAIAADPEQTARWANNPVNENDLHARHVWLRERRADLARKLEGDPDYYDAKIAGWWLWGIACWIGRGFCGDRCSGPWQIVTDDDGDRQLVHLGDAGMGMTRKLVHLGNAGRGVCRSREDDLYAYFQALSNRLSRVRVCCGDWSRICGPTPTVKQGLTGVVLDPPYSAEAGRDINLYAEENGAIAHDVRVWCIKRGDDPRIRIALCGYEGEHNELIDHGWSVVEWKANGGYASQGSTANVNATRERIWFSPHCLIATNVQEELF